MFFVLILKEAMVGHPEVYTKASAIYQRTMLKSKFGAVETGQSNLCMKRSVYHTGWLAICHMLALCPSFQETCMCMESFLKGREREGREKEGFEFWRGRER